MASSNLTRKHSTRLKVFVRILNSPAYGTKSFITLGTGALEFMYLFLIIGGNKYIF
jgi:hypothetical protein